MPRVVVVDDIVVMDDIEGSTARLTEGDEGEEEWEHIHSLADSAADVSAARTPLSPLAVRDANVFKPPSYAAVVKT